MVAVALGLQGGGGAVVTEPKIDLLATAIMGNHLHPVVRLRPEVVVA
jgi:hypothetical protein